MRIVLVGSESFIARHVSRCAEAAGLKALALPHDADLTSFLDEKDRVINFARHPDFQKEPYDRQKDNDLKAAEAVAKKGARFVMLSTRRVYGAAARWGATEDDIAEGDETLYGRNKASSEAAVRRITEQNLIVLRLSNIIGFEYPPAPSRKTFMAMLLSTLQAYGAVVLDMSPNTGKDFLPVEICAEAIVRAAISEQTGIFNVGNGFATPCGALATAVMAGFGGGRLITKSNEIYDAFFLNIDKWQSEFGQLQTPTALLDYCTSLGRRLRDA